MTRTSLQTVNKRYRISKGQSKQDNPEKLATRWRKTKPRQKYSTLCAGLHHTQTNTNNANKTCALLQTTADESNRTLFSCGNRNGHHNSELGT